MLQQMIAVAELGAGMISVRTKGGAGGGEAARAQLGGDRGVKLSRKAREMAART